MSKVRILNHPHLTVVVPCYNPTPEWAQVVLKYFSVIESEIYDVDLIIVNDGSTINYSMDNYKLLYDMFTDIEIISYKTNRGKGHALRTGVKNAVGDYVIYTDVDFPYTHESFMKVYNSLKLEADIVVGVRDSNYMNTLPTSRQIQTRVLQWINKNVLGLSITDTQCGLKGFNQKGREVFLNTTIDTFLFDAEFIKMAERKQLNIKSVLVTLRHGIKFPDAKTSAVWNELKNLFTIFKL